MDSGQQARLAAASRLFDLIWNERALDRMAEVFTPDAVIHRGNGDYSGIDQIRDQFMAPFQAAFPDLHHTIDAQICDGDTVAMRFHGAGTHRARYDGRDATNRRVEYDGLVMLRIEGDRIAEIWTHSQFGAKFAEL